MEQAQGRDEDAIKMYDRAIELREKAYGPEHPSLTSTLGNKANSLLRLDRLDEAEAAQRRALSIAEKVHGPDAVPVAYPLTGLAEVVAVSGRPAEALSMFERALKIREGAPIDPGLIGATRFGLARALFDTGGDKQRAKQLAQQARQDYMASHRVQHEELEIIDRFLAELER